MVVIFGSAGNLGLAISELLLRDCQDAVLMTANSSLKDIQQYEEIYPGKAIIKKCDVSKPSDIVDIFDYIEKNNITISGIVNNFAFTFSDNGNKNFSSDNADVKKVFEINYFGLAKILELTVSWALKHEVSGLRVVNILSNSIKTLNASNSHYIASKSAVQSLTTIYAKQYSQFMAINCVAPGLMKSKLTEARFESTAQSIIELTPLGRLVNVEEVAEVVRYFTLLSPISVCGQTVYVDGGRTL
jgi:NAD(P)-dependent dehydrogenase (short-subunit alcohol dehydrogenase family)